jgi:hypothetical protein
MGARLPQIIRYRDMLRPSSYWTVFYEMCVSGETGLHVCFLVPTSTHAELAKRMIARFPKVGLEIQTKLSFVCRLHTAFLHWPLSSAATKKVQGPDTT